MADQNAPMLDHDYDGIRELDNDLPRWWVWLFVITIIWGVLYLLYFHVLGVGYLSGDEYLREMNPNYMRLEARHHRFLGILPEYHSPFYDPVRDHLIQGPQARPAVAYVEQSRESDTSTYVALSDEASVKAGLTIFQTKCATCHGKLGEGGIGPNLTDDYWLHGAGISNIYKTVKYGAPAKGMLSWRLELQPQQILQVASFVMTMHGSNPPNPKAPQGELVKP
jgi:cytochrome c oxidase cbb3-type subunit 3